MIKSTVAVISAALVLSALPLATALPASAADSDGKTIRIIGPIPNMMALKLKDVGHSDVELSTMDVPDDEDDVDDATSSEALTMGVYDTFSIESNDITGFDGAKAQFEIPAGCSPASQGGNLNCEFGTSTFSSALVDANGEDVPFVEKLSDQKITLQIIPKATTQFPLEATLFLAEAAQDEEGNLLADIAAETFQEYGNMSEQDFDTQDQLDLEERELTADLSDD